MQALSYDAQLRWKNEKVKEVLVRIGGFDREFIDSIAEEPIGAESPFRYRNKAQVPFGRNRDGEAVCGFYAGRTHHIVARKDCLLSDKLNEEILNRILAYLSEFSVSTYDEVKLNGLLRHVLIREGMRPSGDKNVMVCLVVNGDGIPHEEELVASLREVDSVTSILLNVNTKNTNVILGNTTKTLWGEDYIIDTMEGLSFRISPLSFYQVNHDQAVKLYNKALEYADLSGNEIVFDLYCGTGTISLFLARKARMVYGVEIVDAAIEDAKKNAAGNGIENARFYCGKSEEVAPRLLADPEVGRPDVIVVDPPRKGCDSSLLETILEVAPDRVVYVSCDPATLARDLKILCADGGYSLERVTAVDQFCQTGHIETVCLLSNRKPDARVKIDVDLEDYYRIKDEQKKNKASE